MNINPTDCTNYFKGLLVLACREKPISYKERNHLINTGRTLGLSDEVITSYLGEAINNKNTSEEIPCFSSHEIAELFLKDGIKLSFADNMLSLGQIDCLIKFAVKNKLSKQWFFIELENFLDNYQSVNEGELELQRRVSGLNSRVSFAQ